MIVRTKHFPDGQAIHILGSVSAETFQAYWHDTHDQAFVQQWSDQQRAHHALRVMVSRRVIDVAQWLDQNQACVTYWVDPAIFSVPPMSINLGSRAYMGFEWGLGFRPDDPLAQWFVLRWT